MNRKRILALLALGMFSATAFSQIMPDNSAQVCAYWSKGDSITYDCIAKSEKTDRNGEKTIVDSSSEKRKFTVIAEDENSYTLQVSYEDVFSSNMSINLNMSTESYSELCSTLKYNVITDELGTIQSLGDLEQSLEVMKELFPMVLEKAYAGIDKKGWKTLGVTKEQMIQHVTDSFCTPEMISKSCIGDVNPLLFFHGGRYDFGKEYSFEETFNNIIGEGEITADTHFWIDSENSDSTYLVMRTYTKIGTEKLMPMLRDATIAVIKTTLTDQSIDAAQLFDEEAAASHMGAEMEQYTATMIHLPSGWTVQWISDRYITVYDDNGKQENTRHEEVVIAD